MERELLDTVAVQLAMELGAADDLAKYALTTGALLFRYLPVHRAWFCLCSCRELPEWRYQLSRDASGMVQIDETLDFDWSREPALEHLCTSAGAAQALDLAPLQPALGYLIPVRMAGDCNAAFLLELEPGQQNLKTSLAPVCTLVESTAPTLRRILAEEKTKSTGELYRSLVEEAGDVLVFLSPDLHVLEWNREAELLFGWDSHEAIGKEFLDLCVAPAHWSPFNEHAATVLAEEKQAEIETPATARDGRSLQIAWRLTRIAGLREYPFGVVSVGRDVADQRRMEDNLRLQIHRLEVLRNVQSIFHSATTVEAVVEQVYTDLPGLLGVDRATVLIYEPETDSLFIHSLPDTQPIQISISGLAHRQGKPIVENDCLNSTIIPDHIVEQLSIKSCVSIPLSGTSGPVGVLRLDDTQCTGRFKQEEIPFLQLVAEHLGPVVQNALLFAEREKVVRALRDERTFMNAVLDSASTLIIVLDAAGLVVRFNRACQEVTGYDAQEVLGSPFWEKLLPDDDRQPTLDFFANLKKLNVLQKFENEWLDKQGGRHLIAWNAAPLYDESCVPSHVVGIGTEVTNQRKLEKQDDLLGRFGMELAGVTTLTEAGSLTRSILQEAFDWDAYYLAVRKSGKGSLQFLDQWDTISNEKTNLSGSEDFKATSLLLKGPLGPGTPLLINREPDELPETVSRFGDRSRPSASLMFVPVRVGKEIVGICSVQSYTHRRYSETDINYLLKLCNVLGPALKRCQAEHESSVLLNLGKSLNEARTMKDAVLTALKAADSLFGYDSAFMNLIAPDTNRVDAVVNVDIFDGVRTEVPLSGRGYASDMSMKTMREGPQLVLRKSDSQVEHVIPFGDSSRLSASLMFVPVRYGENALGVLSIQSYTPDAYSEHDLPRLEALADFCAGTFERTRLEEENQERESRYRQAITGSGSVPYEKDYSTHHFLFIGEGIEVLTGYKAEEFTQQIWDSIEQQTIMHGETAGLDKRAAADLALAGKVQTWRADIRIKHRNGQDRWLYDSSVQLFGDDGKPYGSLGILQDITDRKQAEESLRESENRFDLFMSNVPAMAFIKDDQGRYIYANKAWKKHLGFIDDSEWHNRTDFEVFPESAGLFLAHDDEVRNSGQTREFVEAINRGDGKIEYTLVNKFVLPGRNNQQLLGAFAIDITDRKRAEEALRESEERYALAVQGSNDGLWDWDLRSNRVYYSPRWRSILGLTKEKLTNSPEEWLGRIHFDDAVHVRLTVEDHIAAGGPHFNSEHRLLHADGDYRWMLVRGYAVRGTGGRAYRMAGSLTDITGTKLAEEQLKHGAYHDTLTALPNRKLFTETLARAVARAKRKPDYKYGVLFLDLDRFKVINDSLGHAAGDQLLIEIARRLESCVRPGDTIARLGGDEFTVLLEDISGEADATRVANRILDELGKPFDLDGHEIYTTASIGIALSTTGYDRPEDILRDSDTAMYRAKASGKARHEMFDMRMHATAVEVLRLESDLRRAVEHQSDFFLVYQPILELTNSQIIGFEALVRWQHPERGMILPAQFLPMAEELNLMVPLGNWVIREGLRQLSEWQREKGREALTLSVNLSSAQFRQSAFVEMVSQMLSGSGVQPNTVVFELTESELMDNAETLLGVMAGLKDLGLELHVDDFGTGYSSLAYLHRFPIDALKIDRLFVSHLGSSEESNEIVRAIISLGHSMKQRVIAEGIEKPSHLEILQQLDCDFGQGYLFSKPLPATEAKALLESVNTLN